MCVERFDEKEKGKSVVLDSSRRLDQFMDNSTESTAAPRRVHTRKKQYEEDELVSDKSTLTRYIQSRIGKTSIDRNKQVRESHTWTSWQKHRNTLERRAHSESIRLALKSDRVKAQRLRASGNNGAVDGCSLASRRRWISPSSLEYLYHTHYTLLPPLHLLGTSVPSIRLHFALRFLNQIFTLWVEIGG